jgi:hypothetical protein
MDLSKLNDSDYEAFKAGRLSDMSDAGYEYVKSQRAATIPSSQEPEKELSTMDKITRALNFESGLGRGALATAIEPLVGKELVTGKEITSGTVPSSEELAKKAGVDLTYMYPAFARNLAKLTGQEGKLQSLAGATANVYLDPATFLAPMARAAQVGAKGAKLGATKFLETMLDPMGVSLDAIGKGISKVTPSKYSIMSMVSGVPKEAIETYSKNKSIIDELDPAAAEQLAQDAAEQAKTAVASIRQKQGTALSSAIKEAGDAPVSIVDLKKQLLSSVTPREGALKNKAAQETFDEIRGKVDQLLTTKQPVMQTVIDPITLSGVNVPSGKTVIGEIPDQLSAFQLFEMKQQIKEMGDLYGGKGGILSKLGAQNAPLSSKEFTESLTSAVKNIDSMIDDATKGASKEARDQYAKLSKEAREADRYFSTPEKTLSTLSNLSTNAKAPARRILKNVDQSFGTNLEQTGKLIESAKYFNEPSMQAISSGRTTSTTRTLSGAGVGGAIGSAIAGPVGGAIGGAIGAASQSPAAVKNIYLPAAELVSRMPSAPKNIPPQIWAQMLKSQSKEQEQ